MKKAALLLTLIIIVSMFSGCFRTIKTKDGSVTVGKDGNVEVQDNEGNKSSVATGNSNKGTTLPQGYPKEIVPIMGSSKVIFAMKNTNNKKDSFSVGLETDKNISETSDFYKNVMKDAEDLNVSEGEDMCGLSGKKGDYQVTILIDKNSDTKKVGVTIGLEPAE